LFEAVLKRLVDGEKAAATNGAASLRTNLLVRALSSVPLSHSLPRYLLQHILQQFPQRHGLGVTWLYYEFLLKQSQALPRQPKPPSKAKAATSSPTQMETAALIPIKTETQAEAEAEKEEEGETRTQAQTQIGAKTEAGAGGQEQIANKEIKREPPTTQAEHTLSDRQPMQIDGGAHHQPNFVKKEKNNSKKKGKEREQTNEIPESGKEDMDTHRNENGKKNRDGDGDGDGDRYATVLKWLVDGLAEQAAMMTAPNDQCFIRLLLDAPMLTPAVLQTLDRFSQDPQTVGLGLAALRDISLQRVQYRMQCLTILLHCTISPLEAIRTPAIKLVADKLYQEQSLAPAIEDYATRHLLSLIQPQSQSPTSPVPASPDTTETGGPSTATTTAAATEPESGEGGLAADGGIGEGEDGADGGEIGGDRAAVGEEARAGRELCLYFGLVGRKPQLIERVVDVYTQASLPVKRAIHRQAPALFRSIGVQSPHILPLVTACPKGAEKLVLQALHALLDSATGGMAPPRELVRGVQDLFGRVGDARFLVPVVSWLSKDEVVEYLPKLVVLPGQVVRNVIHRLLHYKPSPLTPEELLVALHTLDQKDNLTLRKAMEATQFCFEQKGVYKQAVLAIVLQQLVDVIPIPPLFMRTAIQTITRYPKLMGFMMSMLSRLITKQIWNDARLWQGFVHCCRLTQPDCLPVLLQLPPPQLQDLLTQAPDLKEPLVQFLEKNPTSISRATQAILGLV
jgi:hypothetical protein